jgi:hypothetical protein
MLRSGILDEGNEVGRSFESCWVALAESIGKVLGRVDELQWAHEDQPRPSESSEKMTFFS